MVLAPLCSGGVTHSVAGLPHTPAGTLWAPLSYHGPSEARKRWASPGLPPATPGTEVFQSFRSFSSPKKQARVSLGALIYDTCFACALFSAYSPLRPPHSCAERLPHCSFRLRLSPPLACVESLPSPLWLPETCYHLCLGARLPALARLLCFQKVSLFSWHWGPWRTGRQMGLQVHAVGIVTDE